MTRPSKQSQRRALCPRKLKCSFAQKTGPKKDALPEGYRVHQNSVQNQRVFIPKVK